MMAMRNCPRCLLEISTDRLSANPVVCDSCGHVLSPLQKEIEAKLERNFLYSVIGASLSLVVGFMHVVSWGSASLEVITFSIADLADANSPAAIESMAKACLELKKYECTEKMYAKLARLDVQQQARLGKFQLSQRKFKEASDSFRRFFAAGGNDVDASYSYAKALGEIGDIDEAVKHFDYVLEAKPEVLQVTVMQNYVKYLMGANRLDHAKRVIQKVRRRDQTVSSFMDSELKVILARMDGRS